MLSLAFKLFKNSIFNVFNINCGQFSKSFKISQKLTALFIFNDAYFKQTLIYYSNFINNLNSIFNSDSERWQNSYFTADKIITNSEKSDLNLDAENLEVKRWEHQMKWLKILLKDIRKVLAKNFLNQSSLGKIRI